MLFVGRICFVNIIVPKSRATNSAREISEMASSNLRWCRSNFESSFIKAEYFRLVAICVSRKMCGRKVSRCVHLQLKIYTGILNCFRGTIFCGDSLDAMPLRKRIFKLLATKQSIMSVLYDDVFQTPLLSLFFMPLITALRELNATFQLYVVWY